MNADRVRGALAGIGVVVGLLVCGCSAAVAQDADGAWTLSSPLGTVSGRVLVLRGADDRWRCEMAPHGTTTPVTRQTLLHRRGQGWTLVASPEAGFVQPWHEPWRKTGPEAGAALGELFALWLDGVPSAGAPSEEKARWRLAGPAFPATVELDSWAALPTDWRPPGRATTAGQGRLRKRMTARGRGHGGDGLRFLIRWVDGCFEMTTAQWPGRLETDPPVQESVTVPAEAYLPLWPLADFLP